MHKAVTVANGEPSQTLVSVRTRQAGSSQDGAENETPVREEVGLTRGSPISSVCSHAIDCSEYEGEKLSSFPIHCLEYEPEKLGSFSVDCSEYEAEELSSHPVNLEDPNPITADVETCVPKVDEETESVGDNLTSDSFSSKHSIVKR